MKNDVIKVKFLELIGRYSDNQSYNLECWNEIENNYSSNSRHYHTLKHLENMITELDRVIFKIEDLDTLLFSIYYHDIIYKPSKNDNELKSALLFEKRISKTSFGNLNKCKLQIELTKDHKLSEDYDTNVLMDLDLSILGKSPEEYQKYSTAIRKEYKIYPELVYRSGRKKFLKNMLEKNSIYKTDTFKRLYESQAKLNIQLEVNQLN